MVTSHSCVVSILVIVPDHWKKAKIRMQLSAINVQTKRKTLDHSRVFQVMLLSG
jgi:hypothetical protein